MNDKAAALAKASWPVDVVDTEKGEAHITGKYVYPKLSDRAGLIGLLGVAVVTCLVGPWGVEIRQTSDYFAGLTMTVLVIGSPAGAVIGFIAYWLMRRNVNVTITFDSIRIGRKSYPRTVPIEFSVQAHRKAVKEMEKPRPNSTWINAIEVVMRYGEKRITIAEMRRRDEEKAIALVIRMQNWCDRFDAIMSQAMRQTKAETETLAVPTGDFGPAPDIR